MTYSTNSVYFSKAEMLAGYENTLDITWMKTNRAYITHGICKIEGTDYIFRYVELLLPLNKDGCYLGEDIPVFAGKKITGKNIKTISKSFDALCSRIEKQKVEISVDESISYDALVGIDKSIPAQLESVIERILNLQKPLMPKRAADAADITSDFYVSGPFN